MNLFAISILIVICPLVAQIIFGTLIILKKIKLNFDLVRIVNIIAQVLTIIIALKVIETDTQNSGVRCGMPQAAMMFLGIISVIALVIIIGIQIGIRKYRSRNLME